MARLMVTLLVLLTSLPATATDANEKKVDERWFIAGFVDVGYRFLRTRFHAGFGEPHHQWAGVEVNPLVSGDAGGVYGGLRGALSFADIRLGARYLHAFDRSFLLPANSYDHLSVDSRAGPRSRYLALEGQVTGEIPAGPGFVRLEGTVTSLHFVKPGFYVFEEIHKVVVKPPFLVSGELGYLVGFAEYGVRVGPVLEVVSVPGRKLVMVRGGVRGEWRLWEQFRLRATFMPALIGRDKLGLDGGDSFQIGIRYLWASGG